MAKSLTVLPSLTFIFQLTSLTILLNFTFIFNIGEPVAGRPDFADVQACFLRSPRGVRLVRAGCKYAQRGLLRLAHRDPLNRILSLGRALMNRPA